MRNWMTWTMMAVGALAITGCKGKTSSAATADNQSTAQADSTASTASSDQENSQANPPATFHPNATTQPGSEATGKSSAGFIKGGKYVVQVQVFQTRSRAEALEAKLISSGFPAYVAEVESPTADLSGVCYRVRIGGFATRAAAKDFGQNSLKPQGFDYWVDAKANDHVGAEVSHAPSHAVSKPVPMVSTPIPPLKPVPSRSSMRLPVEPAVPAPASPAPSIKPAPAPGAPPIPTPAPSKAMAVPAATESDSIPSPFSRQDYYRPTDDSASESMNPKDAPANTRRTLPTW